MRRSSQGGYVDQYRGETYRVRRSLTGWTYKVEPFGWSGRPQPTKAQAGDMARNDIDRLAGRKV